MKRINYCYWAAIIGVKSIGAILYLGLMSMGLRLIYPEMGVKLSKIIPFLDEFEMTYKWDRAHLAALLILIMSWFLCHLMLKFWISDELVQSLERMKVNTDRIRQIVFTVGGIIMFVDAAVFYQAFNAVLWGGGGFSLTALLATLGYVTLLVAVTFVAIYIGLFIPKTEGRS